MQNEAVGSKVLGLDIGSNSIGWALLNNSKHEKGEILAAGVRIFEGGVNIDEKSGKSLSLGVERRQARARRRQIARRAMRRRTVVRILQEHGMLPAGNPSHNDPAWNKLLETNVYALRAKGLDQKLEPFEFGRVCLHLAHRRGFLSNRKAPPKKNEEQGVVAEKTKELEDEIRTKGARTLGEYLNRINTSEERIRQRYTLRRWYREEFEQLWEVQSGLDRDRLTPLLKSQLTRAIFYQRPLKKPRNLVGFCELEPRSRRAALALLDAQDFRLLQDILHTRVVQPNGAVRPLTSDERKKLYEHLWRVESLKFSKARKLLGLSKDTTFNLEEGGREEFQGNTTAARIREILGARWDAMSSESRNIVVDDLMGMQDEDALARRSRKLWGLEEQAAEALSQVGLESGYARHSRKAMRKLLPIMKEALEVEQEMSYAEAVIQAYPNRPQSAEAERLPPIENLRNPIVQRALSELRRVMNALVAQYGKPSEIRIELARELKQNAKAREDTWKNNRQRERERKKAAELIFNEIGIKGPKNTDIEKMLLWEECRRVCPFTGKGISAHDLLGDEPRFDIAHIIPFSRSLDNSFANKTLCDADENRHRMLDRTPHEAYADDSARYQEILARVKSFTGSFRDEKLRRFKMEGLEGPAEFLEGFASRQLNDTRYASRRAAEYVGLLFAPDERKRRVQVTTGRVTAYLRSAWALNGILGDGNRKSRNDHRHHAVDAVAVALTTPAAIRALTVAAQQSRRPGSFRDVPLPWPSFVDDVKQALSKVIVSHRVDRRVNGQLHQDTFYGRIRDAEGRERCVIRKPLAALTEADIRDEAIVDKAVRNAVLAKLKEEAKAPAKAFAEPANHPVLLTAKGRRIPVHRVRVFQNKEPETLGEDKTRLVQTGSNHHLAVFLAKDRKGNESYRGEIVSRLEAMRRLRDGQPVITRKDGEGNPLVFSLAINDMVELEWAGGRLICIVQKLSHRDYNFRLQTDARRATALGGDQIRIRSDSALYAAKVKKYCVDPLGRLHVSHD